ncbi:alpha/beta hydrolase family protein [Bacillus cereus group sp. BfR-BA-01494]|uniref:alpha/beta hydrolase n=1 Tax=Bacillus cereus group sp. BfR-BA-01494 TaxID=2920362 RepID=UPI001F59DE26
MFVTKYVDKLALYDLHKKRSKVTQYVSFKYETMKHEEREKFYNTYAANPQFNINPTEDRTYSSGNFNFRSSISLGDKNNDMVSGEVYLNSNENAPNVIFVHGWRMDSNARIKNIFHKDMLNLGWNMYYFTLPYHFEREPEESTYSGEFMISANIERTVVASRQAVADLRAFIQWIKSNKSGPVILIGVSLGGFITNLTATLESNIDVLVSVFYANRLSYSIWHTNPGMYIKKDLVQNGVTYDVLKEKWKITEPSVSKPKMDKDNILLISAKHDQYVHMEDTSYLWESWEKPTRLVYNCGHSGIVLNRKRISEDTISFIRSKIFRYEY